MAANGVKQQHTDYAHYSAKWKRVRDVVAGQDAIHAAGIAYLPKLIEEAATDYDARLRRTPFYNATWRTMAGFVGMMFRKPPTVEVPKKLEVLLEDVTMTGVSFNNFAQDVALEDLGVSRVGVLVDFPSAVVNPDGTALTMAQAEALGLRPSMARYTAEQIINWRHEWIGNKRVLTQVRLSETRERQKNEFEVETYEVIRVLDLFFNQYRVRFFKAENEVQEGTDVFPTINGKKLAEIPFYFIGPDGADTELTEPVLIDLVDLNLKHFQVSADYEHGCHLTALPTPVVSGATQQFNEEGKPIEQKLYIGSASAWMLPQGADAKFLEFTGQGLQALEKNLDRKEAQMAAIGARMLAPEKSGVEAADTLSIRHSGENSVLAAIAVAVSEGLTKALKMFAAWANVTVTDDNVKFEINRDFMPFPLSPQALTALLSAVQAGKMSDEALFDILKRGDLHEADLKWADEQARIDANSPPPALPAPIGGVPGEDDEDDDEDKPEGKGAAQ